MSTVMYTGFVVKDIGQRWTTLGVEMALTEIALKHKLTEIKALQQAVASTRKTISDGRGLFLEVMPTGAASWRYRYQLHGKTEKVSLGPYPALSLKEATQKSATRSQQTFSAAISPARQKQLEESGAGELRATVKEFSERYFAEVIAKGPEGRQPNSAATWRRKSTPRSATGRSARSRLKTFNDWCFARGTMASSPPPHSSAIS